MHMQGGTRGGRIAHPGEIVHEGNGIHEYRVVDASAHTVTLENLRSGEQHAFGAGEFKDRFEY